MSVSSSSASVWSWRPSDGPTPVTHRMKQHGMSVFNHFPLSSNTHRGRLGALASFSSPADPITAATEGQDPAARQQLRPGQEGNRGEGRGKQLEVKAAAAAGGQRWMNSTPQDQSGTRSHSRSSFFSSTLVNTTSSLPPTNHITPQPIWHLCATYVERGWLKKEWARKHETESVLVRKRLGAGVDVLECIDCFHCGIIAIKSCKQASGSVSLPSPSRMHGSADASLHISSTSWEKY